VQITQKYIMQDGRELGWGSSHTLDNDGRATLEVYAPISVFWMEASRFPGGDNMPTVETPRLAVEAGQTLPEQTIVLERLCGVEGVALHPDGTPLRGATLLIKAVCADGNVHRAHAYTDRAGRFKPDPCIRPGSIQFSIVPLSQDMEYAPVELEQVACVPDEITDLGVVQFVASRP
jgi:hypothetical protein